MLGSMILLRKSMEKMNMSCIDVLWPLIQLCNRNIRHREKLKVMVSVFGHIKTTRYNTKTHYINLICLTNDIIMLLTETLL